MRKVFLWAMLVLVLVWAGIAGADDEPDVPTPYEPGRVSSEAFDGFGLFTVYSTDNPVILRADGEPYFDNVTKFTATEVRLAAKFKEGVSIPYGSNELPHGTLTDMASGFRYKLSAYETYNSGAYRFYRPDYSDLASFAGKRVMWNLFTSPDVLVGAAKVPALPELSRDIADDEIVPCLRIYHSTEDFGKIGRVSLYFARKNRLNTPVALGDSVVQVSFGNDRYRSSRSFDNFDKPVRNTFNPDISESNLQIITVQYDKDGARYIWNFTPMFGAYSGIEWGKLELSAQPLTIKEGESVDVVVKLPGIVDLEEAFGNGALSMTAGNGNVVGVADTSFEQGSASWSGLTWNETKSVWTVKLWGNVPGRTSLVIHIPNVGTYFREVQVVDANGSMNLPSSADAHGLSLAVVTQHSRARMVNGRPYYPSAESEGTDFVLNGDYPDNGALGLVRGTEHEVHPITGHSLQSEAGVKFNTADSYDCTEHPSMTVKLSDAGDYEAWLEFNDDPNLNIASIPLSSLLSADYMTTSEQLENFAPYFEMKRGEDLNVVSLDWSFVNPSTGEKVTPAVSDVVINSTLVEGTSGTIEYSISWNVHFEYTYKDVRYIWNFYEMDYGDYGWLSTQYISAGDSADMNVDISKSADLEAVDISIWEEDILSADPVHFVPADEISFDLFGLKEGRTTLALVFARKGYDSSPYDKYTRNNRDIMVGTALDSAKLTPTFAYKSEALIAEGLPVYYSDKDTKSIEFELELEEPMSYADFFSSMGSLNGTLHLWSGDTEVLSFDLMAEGENDWDPKMGTIYHVSYTSSFGIDGLTHVSWEFPAGLIENGSADVPANVRSTAEQLASYKPYVKLQREGLNIASAEWYFADGSGKKTSPEGISNPKLRVFREMMSNIDAEGTEGSLEVNAPDIFVNRIRMTFEEGGVLYKWNFRPVDNSSNTPAADDIISWDVASPDLPLIMRVGDTQTVTLSAANIAEPSVYVGNSSVVAMETVSTSGNSVTVKLTAKSAGMTSIVLTDGSSITWPREIWVADADGKVPHLTDDIDAFVEELTGGTDGWYDYSEPDSGETGGDSGNTEPESPFKTEDPAEVLEGLSVYPRFVMPADPSPDAYTAVWNEIDSQNLDYNAYMFEDNTVVLASRDAEAEFMTLSRDLISRHPEQLLALVLPDFRAEESGLYTFRVPTDHITLEGTKLFMHTNAVPDENSGGNSNNGAGTPDSPAPGENGAGTPPAGYSLIPNGSLYDYTDGYSVIVSIDLNGAGEAKLIVTESDLRIPTQLLSYDIMSTDVGGNISKLRVYGIVPADEIEGSFFHVIQIVAHTPDGEESTIEWSVHYEVDGQGMTVYNDEGTELESLNGEDYINVSVYLNSGRYAPYITVKATSNDIRLIGVSAPSPEPAPESGDVPPEPASGDVPPAPSSGDVPPAPSSGDVPPAPSSGDVPPEPASGDVPPEPSSGDVPPAPSSGDVPPEPSGDNTGGGAAPSGGSLSRPGFSLSSAVVNKILGLLARLLPGGTQPEVAALPDSAIGGERTSDDLTSEDLAQIPSTQTVALVLPIIVVTDPAVYVFGVDMPGLAEGTKIFMHMMHEAAAASSDVRASADEPEPYVFLDDDGGEITAVPANKHVNIAAYMEPGGSYAPVITIPAASGDKAPEPASGDKKPEPASGDKAPVSRDFTLRVSKTEITVAAGSSATVTLTPVNASGDVVYSVSEAWVSVRGNVATIAPTAAVSSGLHRVSITGADRANRTATAFINVTVTGGAAPASGDQSGGGGNGGSGGGNPPSGQTSGDVAPAPASRDVTPAPTSRDVTPAPAPASPDNPAPAPAPASGDVTPHDDGNNGGENNNDNNENTGGTDTNGGNGGGTDTNDDATKLRPSQPGFSLGNTSITNRILGLLRGYFTSTPNVTALPDSAVGNDRTADDLTDEELASIPTTETVAFVLPIIVVTSPAVYVFGVDVSRLAAGTPIFMYMMFEAGTAGSAVTASDADGEACVFLDDYGNEITTVPANGHVNIAAYMQPGGSYAPVITTGSASGDDGDGSTNGGNGTNGNNTNGNTGTNGNDTSGGNGEDGGNVSSSSSSGCDSGVGAFALAVCAFFMRRRTTK